MKRDAKAGEKGQNMNKQQAVQTAIRQIAGSLVANGGERI